MHDAIVRHMKDYRDAREQDVPPSDPMPCHAMVDGIHATAPDEPVTDGSRHRAFLAQQRERDLAIRDTYDDASTELLHENLLDSQEANRLAPFLELAYPDMPRHERAAAASVALRVFDPMWMLVSRYHAAESICGPLRLFLAKHFSASVPEKELREFADKIAGIAKQEIVGTCTAKRPTTAREWAAARLGMLIFGETAE